MKGQKQGVKKGKRRDSMSAWLAWESTIIIIASVMASLLVKTLADALYGPKVDGNLVSLGMILPMGIIMGVVSHLFNRRFRRYVRRLTDGLHTVASGTFDVQLEQTKDNPLGEAYGDFNRMARELGSVQTLREDFINNFSHEFKTPITAIRGFAELLQEPGFTEEERQEYLGIIAEESARLAELSSNTLFLSKLESQQVIQERKEFLLDEQMKRCAILLANQWEEKEIAFSAELQEDVIYKGNEELMRHVWLNLLGNAIKYTPRGGEVSLGMTAQDGTITVTVSDTGIGMTDEVRAHIFDKYYQGDTSHAGKGLGLGLSIVHRIVELCGGEITVDSTDGQGSVFTVTLPA